jgi:hypothetical protein
MYRSASTLQFQIAARLVKDARLGQQVGWIDAKRFAEVQREWKEFNGLKVVKVHIWTAAIAAEFHNKNAAGIYTFRDLRDVYASSMKQRQKTFNFLWNEGFIDHCLENYKHWTSLPNVLISRYEEIVTNLSVEVRRIAQHLNISVTLEQCQAIADELSLKPQLERIQQFKETLLRTPLNPEDHREIVDYHDEATLLHMNHIDSAKVGRWKGDLIPQQVEMIENHVHDWCIKRGICPLKFFDAANEMTIKMR